MAPPRPLYRQLADKLRLRISGGELTPGEAFPPELEICDGYGVSRHTAREALRILTEDGLIERRRGAGTIVTASVAPAFAQAIGSFEHLLQYADNTLLEIGSKEEAGEDILDRFGLSERYLALEGVRRVKGRPPQAAVLVLVRWELADHLELGAAIPGAIIQRLEAGGHLTVGRVAQRMEAVGMPEGCAGAIGVPPGSPALRTVRRYRDQKDEVAVLSESFHPEGRFAYEISVDRRSGGGSALIA